jgi:hypothetical protein
MRCIRNAKPGDNCNNQIVASGDHRRAPIVGQLLPLPGQLVRFPFDVAGPSLLRGRALPGLQAAPVGSLVGMRQT